MSCGGDIYYRACSRTKYKLTRNQPATESCRGEPTPLSTPDSVAASVLSVYGQPELSLSTRAGGSSARWVSADLEPRMTTSNINTNFRPNGNPRKKRAHNRQCTPLTFGGGGGSFGGRRSTPESKKRKTAVLLSGVSGVSGVFTHPLLQFGGGGVSSHVRVVRAVENGGGFYG